MKDFSFKAKIRLYIKSNLIIKQKLIVETKQSHYLLNVMRKKVNDTIFVFNELQGEFEAEIITVNKKK